MTLRIFPLNSLNKGRPDFLSKIFRLTTTFSGWVVNKIELKISFFLNKARRPPRVGVGRKMYSDYKKKTRHNAIESKIEDIKSAVKSILEDIRITCHSILKKSPFELHFGRKSNTEWSNFRDKLICSLNLDQQKLEISLLRPEEMRESADSRTRMKAVKKGMVSRDVSPKLKKPEEEPDSIRTLENLAKAVSDWKSNKSHLTHKEGSEALRKLTERNPLLAASRRSDLNQGTLRFRVEQETPAQRTKTSNIEFDLIHYPEKVVVYRKILDRQSGGQTVYSNIYSNCLMGKSFKSLTILTSLKMGK